STTQRHESCLTPHTSCYNRAPSRTSCSGLGGLIRPGRNAAMCSPGRRLCSTPLPVGHQNQDERRREDTDQGHSHSLCTLTLIKDIHNPWRQQLHVGRPNQRGHDQLTKTN